MRAERKLPCLPSAESPLPPEPLAPELHPTSFQLLPLACANCGAEFDAAPIAVCENCLGPLEPVYPDGPRPTRDTIAQRDHSLWRYREFLPLDGAPELSLDSGFTPLLESPALAHRLGVARVWLKNDAVSHPVALLQGPGRRRRPQRGQGTRPGHGGLRLDRQPGQRGGGPVGPRRPPGLDLHPPRSRAGQGHRHGGVRSPSGPGPRHLRRRQPALHPGGRPVRLGHRQRESPRATTARDRRPWRSRSRSSWAGVSRPRWSRRWRAARWSPSCARASASFSRLDW